MSNSEETFANFVQSEEDRQAFQDRLDQEDRIEAIAKAMKKADEEDLRRRETSGNEKRPQSSRNPYPKLP